jgi:hypothetical protein
LISVAVGHLASLKISAGEDLGMLRSLSTRVAMTSAAIVLLGVLVNPGYAAGPFDGTWQLDAPGAGGSSPEAGSKCPAVRLRFEVKDNQVVGRFERSPDLRHVETGEGHEGTPVTGSVGPDGTLTTKWEGINASGKLAGNAGQLKWIGDCGPRVGTLARVS